MEIISYRLEASRMHEGLGMLLVNMKIICVVDDETIKVDGQTSLCRRAVKVFKKGHM